MIKIFSNKKMKEYLEEKGSSVQYKTVCWEGIDGELSVAVENSHGLLGKENMITSIRAVEELLTKIKRKKK